MKQVMIARRGGVENLQIKEAPLPVPGRGQLRIRVQAAGVNFADVMMRLGLYPDAPKLPAVPGYEVAGVVDAVGDGISPEWLEQPVLAMCNFGGLLPSGQAVASSGLRKSNTVTNATSVAMPITIPGIITDT